MLPVSSGQFPGGLCRSVDKPGSSSLMTELGSTPDVRRKSCLLGIGSRNAAVRIVKPIPLRAVGLVLPISRGIMPSLRKNTEFLFAPQQRYWPETP